jgi:hypothetical protein
MTSLANDIVIIYDQNSRYQADFVAAIETNISSYKDTSLKKLDIASPYISTLQKSAPDLTISLTSDISKKIIGSGIKTKTLHALTTLASAKSYAPCLPDCTKELPQHSFFVLDQPASRQLSLIKLINPNIKDVAIIVTANSAPHINIFKKAAKQHQIIIKDYLTDSEDFRYQIEEISKSSDIILATADTDIYNTSTLSQILLTSYRHRISVIGFSTGFIKAGATSGVVSSITDLAKHLSESLLKSTKQSQYKYFSLVYPKYFDVFSNRKVAKSLNLYFTNDKELKEQLISNEALK